MSMTYVRIFLSRNTCLWPLSIHKDEGTVALINPNNAKLVNESSIRSVKVIMLAISKDRQYHTKLSWTNDIALISEKFFMDP